MIINKFVIVEHEKNEVVMYQKLNLRDRIIAITIAVAMVVVLFAAYPTEVAASETYQGESVQQGTTTYDGNFGGEKPLTYYYSDGYFKDEATTYNSHLATMSIVLSMACMSKSTKRTEDILKVVSCESISSRDFDKKPTKDTIAAVYGHKTIFAGTSAEAELIPIVVRGGYYDMEWVSNFTLGTTGDSKGLNDASSKLLSTIQSYMTSEDINNEDAVFWVMGYSRGGTVANLLGKKLSDLSGVGKEDVFAYSFEAQRAAYNNTKTYDNLHVVSNYNDFLTLLMPNFSSKQKFSYYGTEKIIADCTKADFESNEAKMLTFLNEIAEVSDNYDTPKDFKYMKVNPKITSLTAYGDIAMLLKLKSLTDKGLEPLVSDSYSTKRKTQRDCETLFIDRVKKKAVPNREAYCSNKGKCLTINSLALKEQPYTMEQAAAAIIEYVEGGNDTDKLIENFKNFPIVEFVIAHPKKFKGIIKYLKTMQVPIRWNYCYNTFLKDVWSILDTSRGDYKKISSLLTKEQTKQLKAILPIALYVVAAITSRDIGETTETIASAIENFDSIAQAHYQEINYSWLATEDSFYNPN